MQYPNQELLNIDKIPRPYAWSRPSSIQTTITLFRLKNYYNNYFLSEFLIMFA